MSHLGVFFRRRRVERGLGLGDLARRLGYRNVTKGANRIRAFEGGGNRALRPLDRRRPGANRIRAFEGGGKVHPALLGNLAEMLEITPDEIRRAVEEDYNDWLAWADEPIRPHVVVRLMACVYQRVQLPDDALDPEAAGAFAADIARERKMRAWLVLSRRVSIYFDMDGNKRGRIEATPEMPCQPFAVVGGHRFQFDFGGGVTVRPIDGPPK